jgi:hypothetical protein
VEIEIHLANSQHEEAKGKYALGIKQESRGHRQPFIFYERVWKREKLILDRPDPEDEKDRHRLNQTHL